MKPQIPAVVTTYFEASNANDIASLVACFTQDASVTDENQTHRGAAEIKAWAEETRRRFQFKTEVLQAIESGDGALVTAKVSGNFPGSPAELDFKFTVIENKIGALEIS